MAGIDRRAPWTQGLGRPPLCCDPSLPLGCPSLLCLLSLPPLLGPLPPPSPRRWADPWADPWAAAAGGTRPLPVPGSCTASQKPGISWVRAAPGYTQSPFEWHPNNSNGASLVGSLESPGWGNPRPSPPSPREGRGRRPSSVEPPEQRTGKPPGWRMHWGAGRGWPREAWKLGPPIFFLFVFSVWLLLTCVLYTKPANLTSVCVIPANY